MLAKNIAASFVRGDIIWIKGKSGCGKSTLLKLLPKFRTADMIKINHVDIREYRNESIRKHINYLSQNVPIISGTLLDNLFFNREYDEGLEREMLKDPLLQTILPNREMDMRIFENGSNLSGGEKQKIAFLRAIYDEADVLVLDEITSNIDSKSAADIYRRIQDIRNNKIIFIISHNDIPGGIVNKVIDLQDYR